MNEYEMKTNEKKTKIMRLSYIETRKSGKGWENTIGWGELIFRQYVNERLEERYWRKIRISIAKKAFKNKKSLFYGSMDLWIKKRLVKCYVWSVIFCYTDVKRGPWVRETRIELRLLRCGDREEGRERNELKEWIIRRFWTEWGDWTGYFIRVNCTVIESTLKRQRDKKRRD